MKLRELKLKDITYMFEWMHDENVIKYMSNNFLGYTIEACKKFILDSRCDISRIDLAICDDDDNYMGTVSLKNINFNKAEFAIILRSSAMGKGYGNFAMREILKRGFTELNLEIIYWYVKRDNDRAIKFYNKNNYSRLTKCIADEYNLYIDDEYIWYYVCSEAN